MLKSNMQKIDCTKISQNIYADIKSAVKGVNTPIKLAVIDAGSDQSSKKYISLKMQKAMELGIKTDLIQFGEETKVEEVLLKIDALNKDESVNGILVQLPLHSNLAPFKHRLLNSVNPLKDVDGLSAINFGLYSQDFMNGILPATVDACLEVIKDSFERDLPGTNILIINNSDLVGKPLAMVLSTLGCTVTIANEFSNNLKDLMAFADITVSATGKGNIFEFEGLKEDSLAIDITSKMIDGKTIGDFKNIVDSKNIKFTSVPGGMVPLTIACLLRNLVNLQKLQS